MTLCNAPHPVHSRQVRCDSERGHAGDHFHSFFMRAWEADDIVWTVTVDTYSQGGEYLGGGPVTVTAPTQGEAVRKAIAFERETWGMPRAKVEIRRAERQDGLRHALVEVQP